MELVLVPHARTYGSQNTRVAVPRLPAPEDGRSGEGKRLTPDAPTTVAGHPPPGTAPHHPRGTQPPQGVQAKPGREEPGPDRPPPSTPDGARDRCRTRGGAKTTLNGPTSAQCQDRARCARHTTQGGRERTPRERERTYTQRAHGDYQKGYWIELAERTDRVEWRTSERVLWVFKAQISFIATIPKMQDVSEMPRYPKCRDVMDSNRISPHAAAQSPKALNGH